MLNEEVLKIVLNDKTFGQREAATIVGGRGRLFRLVGSGAIRAEKKPANRQNGRWYCNAFLSQLHTGKLELQSFHLFNKLIMAHLLQLIVCSHHYICF